MSATSNPYGFAPTKHPSGQTHARLYTIATGYATAIYKGQPVILNTNGTITAGTAAADILGVFAGCEYVDANGKPTVSNNWPASQTATNIKAYVWDDPLTEYSVQADGSVAQTAIGDQCDVSNATANGNGMSQATATSALAGAGSQGQFRIIAIDPAIDNAVGDAYTKIIVAIARHQYVAVKVGI